ncbi:MAG: 5-formyltetrahydrofolate cyclo-ligase [Candidatus Magnetoovum sp. WYHC-5]|nr:5-formyltetrahydrofolate cyclo-ligase [Candidatus Magnetoovum sp. WYHC-5]
MDKDFLRKKILAIRNKIDKEIRKTKDEKIAQNLFSQTEYINARQVMFFASFKSEPNTLPMIARALTQGKRVVVPRVNIKERWLDIFEIKDLDELKPGCMNIPEPAVGDERLFDKRGLELIVMPGVVFDSRGGRIGYGGGYYDKLLGQMESKPPLIALAYVEQIVDSVPVLEHDVLVDKIITDEGVWIGKR